MKSVPLTPVFIVLLAFTTIMNAQEQSGEQAVRRVVADFAGEDFVVITGKYLKGRNKIVTYHARLFTDDFQDSHLDVTSVAIRFLRTDVAVARVATKRTENGGKEMRTSFPMFVLTKQGESWLIAA